MDTFDQHGVQIAATSHRGIVRSQNEDQYSVVRRTRRVDVLSTSLPDGELQSDEHYAWMLAVADGLGGHVSGEVASAIAIKTILNFANGLSSWVMRPTDGLREDSRERVELYAQAIQEELQSHAQQHPNRNGMGTTVTAAYFYEFIALVLNLGDSRSYLFRNQSLRQITGDHTLGNELDAGGRDNITVVITKV